MPFRFYLACAIALLTVSCEDAEPRDQPVPSPSRENVPDVVGVQANEASMKDAVEIARSTFDEFLTELSSPRPGTTYSVKVRFEDGDAVEHIWLADLVLEGETLTGAINNEPAQLRNIQLGDRVTVERSRVSDWTILESGRYRGGYTIRYFRDQLSPEEQQAFDREMGATPE